MYDSDSSSQPHSTHTRLGLLKHVAFLVATLFSLALIFTPNTADGAVELVFFRGSFLEAPNSIELEWKTSFESRTAGYFIKRKLSGSDDPAQVISVKLAHDASAADTNFIKAAEDGTTGEDYIVYDFTMVQGETYEYSLWEQEFNASEPTQPEKVFELEASPQKVSSELSGGDQDQSRATATVPPSPSPTGRVTTSAENEATTTTPVTATATFPPTSTPEGAASATAIATTAAENGEDNTQQPVPTVTEPPPEDETQTEPVTEESAPVQITPIPSPTTANSGVAEAAELPQEDTYPEPSPNSPDGDESDQDYVPPATQTPLPISEQNAQPIGEGIEGQPIQPETSGQAIEQVDPNEVSRNRIILWGGFLGSLLFFVAVMIGTILMYRQRQR